MRGAIGHAVTRKFSAAIVGLTLLGVATPAMAVTILDTIDGAAYSPSSGWGLDPVSQAVAVPFSSATAATITNITAYLWGSGSVTLGIMGDLSGAPSGSFINSQSVAVSFAGPVVISPSGWSISAGVPYWLAAIADASCTGFACSWEQAIESGVGFSFTAPFGPGTWSAFSDVAGMASIDASAVPLPAALPLFASIFGFAGLVGWLRRKCAPAATA